MIRSRTFFAAILAAAAMGMLGPAAHAQVTFVNNYLDSAGTGFFDPAFGTARQNAWVAAENVWAGLLNSSYTNETITVSASFADLGGSATSAVVGAAGSVTSHFNFASTNPKYMDSTIYDGALANHLAGHNLDGSGTNQINAFFNGSLDSGSLLGGRTFYYGTDGLGTPSQIDFETVAIHELAHGLGLEASVLSTGKFRVDYTLPNVFDRFLYRGTTGQYLLNEPNTAAGNAQRAADVTSGDLYFRGPETLAYDGGNGAKLWAPATFVDGSSVMHIDQIYPDLMNPMYTGPNHNPSGTDLAILSDMGWDLSVSVPEPASLMVLGVGAGLLGLRRRKV